MLPRGIAQEGRKRAKVTNPLDLRQCARRQRVVRILERITKARGLPRAIVLDNGQEFTSRVLDQWAYRCSAELRFIQSGKPVQNAFVEGFNGKFRDECLNAIWSVSLADAIQAIAAWRLDYNRHRPYSALGGLTPEEFAQQRAA